MGSFKYYLFNVSTPAFIYSAVFLSFSSIKSLTSISSFYFRVFVSKTKYKTGTCLSSSKYLLNMSVKTLMFVISSVIISFCLLFYLSLMSLILFFKRKNLY